jgi:hypothetical protein
MRFGTDGLKLWMQRAHFYVGLYLLLFVWLFALSGLLLNHSEWQFHSFWPEREESSYTTVIQLPADVTASVGAQTLMQKLELIGEIEWLERDQTPDRLEFRVTRPGYITTVQADLGHQTVSVQEIRVNKWGAFKMLHTFSGVRMGDPLRKRDWLVTKLFSVTMDGVAIGLIIMVVTSCYLWFLRKARRRQGAIVLALGVLSCVFFVWGIAWMS